MSDIASIRFDGESSVFVPGSTLAGTVSWNLNRQPKDLSLSLLWMTSGRGDQEIEVITTHNIPSADARGEYRFRFELPQDPFSFTGKLITLHWAIEFSADRGSFATQETFVLSPYATEVNLLS